MLNKLLQIFSVTEINSLIAILSIGLILAVYSTPFAIVYAIATGIVHANHF